MMISRAGQGRSRICSMSSGAGIPLAVPPLPYPIKFQDRIQVVPYGLQRRNDTITINRRSHMAAIILGFLATAGVGTLALACYLFYLTPNHHDSLD